MCDRNKWARNGKEGDSVLLLIRTGTFVLMPVNIDRGVKDTMGLNLHFVLFGIEWHLEVVLACSATSYAISHTIDPNS